MKMKDQRAEGYGMESGDESLTGHSHGRGRGRGVVGSSCSKTLDG